MAEMYFKVGEKEKEIALLACIEEAKEESISVPQSNLALYLVTEQFKSVHPMTTCCSEATVTRTLMMSEHLITYIKRLS